MAENDGNGRRISPGEYVTVTDMGHIVEIQHMARKNGTCHIRKIDADRYVLVETGEIFEFDKATNRSESHASLRKTFKQLRYLINGNFTGAKNELFITLTYAENMQDRERLYTDFKDFMKRLRYRLGLKSAELDYLSVVEPQERGAWHMHVLLRFNTQESSYLPTKVLADVWGHGFVNVRRIEGVDNIGAYLTAYLTDIELTEATVMDAIKHEAQIVFKEVEGEQKKFIKGGRLWRYPPGMNLYRNSRGVKMPERSEMLYKDIKKVVGGATPHYRKSYEIRNDDFENTVTYEQYNLNRTENERK